MRKNLFQFACLGLAVIAAVFWWQRPPAFSPGCLLTDHDVVICAASNMARFGRSDPIVLEHPNFNLVEDVTGDGASIKLHAARNEYVAFQLIFRNVGSAAAEEVDVELGEWLPDSPRQSSEAAIDNRIYQAHYHLVDKGAYTWGPKSAVRDWPAKYPDALVPKTHGCLGSSVQVFDTINLPAEPHENQAVWIESYIPPDLPPGEYSMQLSAKVAEQVIPLQIALTVFDIQLPNKPSIDAIGEVYRSYNLEGAGYDRSQQSWQRMAQCYQQMAHEHRTVFMERTPELPDTAGWQDYIDTYQSTLDGSLFTDRYGYHGTGENTPVTVWRTPWPQEFNIKLEAPLRLSDFNRYERLSKEWKQRANEHEWKHTKFFAYVFDEVDGPEKVKSSKEQRRKYLAMVHEQMDLLQRALDVGTKDNSLDLLWTSHSNPAIWESDPLLDLSDKVRLWSPNASAADPAFLSKRINDGDSAWFYHSGHPAVGAHSINAHGVDMRTWGVIGARYGLTGQFMWAVNLGSDDKPFAEPSYKPDDDRFGNGVLVYPGNQMDKIGFAKIPGPIPSMRLKTWRRGLQDAELFFLAEEKNPKDARELIRSMIPEALASARGEASWPLEPAAWIDFKVRLLNMASQSN